MVSHGVALYARVSTDQQARDNTIASQVAALHERIAAEGDRVLPEHAYIDEGYSGAGLVRPALERLRDAVAMGLVERLYVHAPDRLARRYAHQVLLIEEFRRAGTEVVFLNHPRLLAGSGVVMGTSRHQGGDKGSEQGFAAAAGVVHELEESEVERQLVLRDAPVRAQPGAQQGPGPLHGVDVDLAEAVAILVARVLPASMADRLVLIAPGRQASIDVVLVGVDASALGDGGLDDRLDGRLLHIGQHVEDHLATTLDQAEDGGLVLRQRAAARRARQPAAAAAPPLLATAAGWPLCPATT
jgi:hypothetical protein